MDRQAQKKVMAIVFSIMSIFYIIVIQYMYVMYGKYCNRNALINESDQNT